MAMAQVTDNPAVAEASPVHQQAKQQLNISAPISNLYCGQVNRLLGRIYCTMLLSGNLGWFNILASNNSHICFGRCLISMTNSCILLIDSTHHFTTSMESLA